MVSFWETESFTTCDVAVIGGGITGLSAAIALLERQPSLRLCVLERGLLPSGASTRNAGFACFGSLGEICSDVATHGAGSTLEVIESRWRGLRLLRQRLGDDTIGYENCGGYELLFPGAEAVTGQMEPVNAMLRSVIGGDAFSLRNDLISAFGLNTREVLALVANPFEGHIHTGRMMRALTRLASERGATVLTGASVLNLEEGPRDVRLSVRDPVSGESVVFLAGRVAVCTNAFIPELLPAEDIKPGRGQVLLTGPVEGLRLRGTFHFDRGFYYFRDLGGRVLLGGGRNLAFDQEQTTEFGSNEMIVSELENLLHRVILPETPFRIERRWSGIMGFSGTRLPVVRAVTDRVVLGFGCNGMGVALGSLIGEQTAALILDAQKN